MIAFVFMFATIFLGFATNIMKAFDLPQTSYDINVIYHDIFSGSAFNSIYVRSGQGYSLCIFPKSIFDVFRNYTPQEMQEVGVFLNNDDEIVVFDPFLLVQSTLGFASEPQDIPAYIIRTSLDKGKIIFNVDVYQPDLFDKEKVFAAIHEEIKRSLFPFPYIFQYPQMNDEVVPNIMNYYHYDFMIKDSCKEAVLQTNIPRIDVQEIDLPNKGLIKNVLTKVNTMDDYIQTFFNRKPSFEEIDYPIVGQNFSGYISYGYRGNLFLLYQIALIVGILAFLLAFFLFNHSIITYIVEIEKGIQRASKGDLKSPIRIKGNSELTSLASNINQMVDTLRIKFDEEKKNIESRASIITNLSHDLMTPISTIMGYITLLQDQKHTNREEEIDYLHKAYNKAEALKQMIQNALSYTTLMKEPSKANLRSIPWDDLFSSYCEEAKAIAISSGYKLKIKPSTLDAHVFVSRIYLDRVVGNLFMNSIKHGLKDYPIEISAYEQNEYIVFTVRNATACNENLIRYAKSQQTKIYCNDNASGLGLPICSQLMDLQNGYCKTIVEIDPKDLDSICFFSTTLYLRKDMHD
jgi:signal transduction histidine kinase